MVGNIKSSAGKIAFIDLDGTILNSEPRFEVARKKGGGKIHWPTAFTPKLLDLDLPLEGARESINTLEEENWEIIFLTSRPDEPGLRLATQNWLKKHDFWKDARKLIMKPPKLRFQKTPAWKAAVISSYRAKAELLLFIDDDLPNREAVTGLNFSHLTCKDCL